MTEAEVRQVLHGERARVLLSVWERAWEQYLKDDRRRHYRVRANVVWDNAVALADAELLDLNGVERRGADDMPIYVFDDALAVQLKKTSRRMRTTGILTNARRARLITGKTGMLDRMPELLHVTCGYLLDKAEAGIEAYPVVRTVRRKPEWDFDLREITKPGEGLEPARPVLPYNPRIPSLPTIRPAVKEEDGEGN